jgi:hypothetical protein
MANKLERKLRRTARKRHMSARQASRYVYGSLRRMAAGQFSDKDGRKR